MERALKNGVKESGMKDNTVMVKKMAMENSNS